MKWCMVKDDDGHWFIVPAVNREDWYRWIAEQLDLGDEATWVVPEWAVSIDSYASLEFYLDKDSMS